ncbi:MAG: hypothetical protein C5B59_13065 [Bacteroidetes bacterium]|nr:MAG: hypothetical protein C5B59_13065 [Bacteroidota bacterium]
MQNVLSEKSICNKRELILFSIGFIVLVRLISIGAFGLMPQDAYYQFYGEHLALSYFDHPPMIAYILRIFTSLLGRFSFVIKFADSLVTAFSFYFFWRLSDRFLDAEDAKKSVLLFLSTLMFTILSLVSTPDVPLVLFWIISLINLHSALFLEKKLCWLSAGLFMGLAFDSKYTAVLLPGGLGLFLLISNKFRSYLYSKHFFGMLTVFLITISPVIIWNVQHDFASLRFQSQSRMQSIERTNFDIFNFLGFIGHQAAVLIPILFFVLIYFLARESGKFLQRKLSFTQENIFLLSFFIPGFAVFFLLSFFYWVKLNWTMPAYITGIIWVSRFFNQRQLIWQVLLSFLIHIALAIEIFFYPFHVDSDDTWIGWKELSDQVRIRQQQNPGSFVFSADDYKTSAMLHYYLNEPVYSQNIIGKPALQFDYVGTDLKSLTGKNALFIDSDPDFLDNEDDKPPKELTQYFDHVEKLDPIWIMRNGTPVRKFSVFSCFDYHPPHG